MSTRGLKKLVVVFILLLAIIITYTIVDSSKGNRTFKSVFLTTDTSSITRIEIEQANSTPVILEKNIADWSVKDGEKSFSADGAKVQGLLREFAEMKVARVAATKSEKWNDFHVDDSAGVVVRLYDGNGKLADFIVGKFSFKQSQNPYQRQPDIFSYVRTYGENVVYSVKGMLSMNIKGDAMSYRNTMIVRLNKSDVSKLVMSYPADSSFVLQKNSSGWTVNGQPADSMAVEKYLGQIAYTRGQDFVDKPGVMSSIYTLKIEGDNFTPIEVNAYPAADVNSMIIQSSLNKSSFFDAKQSLTDKLFVSVSEFFVKE